MQVNVTMTGRVSPWYPEWVGVRQVDRWAGGWTPFIAVAVKVRAARCGLESH